MYFIIEVCWLHIQLLQEPDELGARRTGKATSCSKLPGTPRLLSLVDPGMATQERQSTEPRDTAEVCSFSDVQVASSASVLPVAASQSTKGKSFAR